MTGTAMRDADLQQVLSDLPRQLVGMNRTAFVGHEQVRHAALGNQRGTYVGQVFVDPADGPLADGNHPILLSLALMDIDDLALDVDVVHVQIHQLGTADGGRVKRFQDCPVTYARRLFQVRQVQQQLDLVGRQYPRWKTLFLFGKLQLGGHVVLGPGTFQQPAEPAANGDQVMRPGWRI